MSNPMILVVEDDSTVQNLIVTALETQEYRYCTAQDGTQAILEAATQRPDIMLLDLGLPDMDGVEVIQKVRTWSDLPIIVISARTEDNDKIDALDAGADDYLTKPFSVDELLARLRVTLRRLKYIKASSQSDSTFFNGDLTVDYAAGFAYLRGEELHLTPIEYKLLCLLCRNAGKVLTHTFITREIWGTALTATSPRCASLWPRCAKRYSPGRRIRSSFKPMLASATAWSSCKGVSPWICSAPCKT